MDLEIVAALQITPRATLVDVARTLGISPVTVGRRWSRLTRAGTAWVTCYPTPARAFGGLIQIRCEPSRVMEVAQELAGDPHAVTVALTAGRWNILIAVLTVDFNDFGRYLVMRVNRVAGVVETVAHPYSERLEEGSNWRLGGLDRDQEAQLRERQHTASADGSRTSVRPVIMALAEDGRLPLTKLAEQLGISAVAAADRLRRLEDSGRIAFRCELARSCSGWPVTVMYWATVPYDRAADFARRVARLREVRTCGTAASGPNNLIFSVWLHSVEEIQTFQARVVSQFPELTIGEQVLVLLTVKLAGGLMNAAGCRTGVVPIDYWKDPEMPGEGEGGTPGIRP